MENEVISYFYNTFGINVLKKENKKKFTKIKMDKSSFSKIIKMLELALESSEVVMDAGIDLSLHDMKYLDVIEELFGLFFNDKQLEMIQYYILEQTTDEKIEENIPDSPEELWHSLEKIKK